MRSWHNTFESNEKFDRREYLSCIYICLLDITLRFFKYVFCWITILTLFIQNNAIADRCIAWFKAKKNYGSFTAQSSFTSSWVPQPVSENITSAIKFSLMVTRSIPSGDRNTCVTAALLGAVINLRIYRYPFLSFSQTANCLNTVSCVVLSLIGDKWMWTMNVQMSDDHLELNNIING